MALILAWITAVVAVTGCVFSGLALRVACRQLSEQRTRWKNEDSRDPSLSAASFDARIHLCNGAISGGALEIIGTGYGKFQLFEVLMIPTGKQILINVHHTPKPIQSEIEGKESSVRIAPLFVYGESEQDILCNERIRFRTSRGHYECALADVIQKRTNVAILSADNS